MNTEINRKWFWVPKVVPSTGDVDTVRGICGPTQVKARGSFETSVALYKNRRRSMADSGNLSEYRSLNVVVAQPKNCPLGVNSAIKLKNVTSLIRQ